ncbi:MAG: hypothetical protein AAB328_07675, partial [candidate division NC10 bacterium]
YLPLHDNGWDAVRAEACAKTAFTDCTIRGGRGANAYYYCICGTGDTGGAGMMGRSARRGGRARPRRRILRAFREPSWRSSR